MPSLRTPALLAALALSPSPSLAQNTGYLKLDGHQDCMRVLSLQGLSGVDSYSIDLWVRSSSAGSSDKCVVVGSEPSTKWEVNASCGIPDVTFAEQTPGGHASSQVAIDICDGQWHHLALVSDGATITGYLDGVCVDSAPALGTTWHMDGRELVAGARIGGNEDNWNGDLDELRLWRRALSATEVAQAATWKLTSTTDLVSHFPFDAGPGDAIGANHGGLYGNAKVVPHVLRVTEVLDRASWLGTDLTLTGAGFTGSEQVTVGGSSAPVVLATSGLPYSMTVALGPTAPGPTEVVVTRPGASDVGQVALLPTLAIKSTGLGGDATIDLQATGVGIAVLGLSGLAMPPVPIPPSWHGLELDPTAGFTVLAVASPGASGAHQWSLPVPSTPSLAGVTVHLQAWAMEGFFSPATSSFSNRVALTL